jgi:PAS domain S-box-containing protein
MTPKNIIRRFFPEEAKMELKPLQILLVDDDSNLLATMQDILKAKGFEPILARTGALALVQSGAADIDVALIDLYLEDMPGLELLGRLKTLTPGIECILLTGHASQGSAIEAINAGAFAYFQKPCDIDQLVLSIQRAGEKRAAGQALRANEERFRSLIENSSDIICHLNTDGTLRYISPSVERVLGYTTADIVIGTGLLDYIHPDDLAPFLEAFSQRVQNPESKPVTMQLRVRHKDGTWRTLEGIATNFFQPSLMEGIIINAHDITARKQAEDAIRLSEKSYRDLFEGSIAGISQALPDGRLLRVNRAYAQIYGYDSPEQMLAEVNNIDSQLYAHPGEREEVLQIIASKGQLDPREVSVVRRDGTQITILVAARPITDSLGNLVCYQATQVEITERKQAEAALRENEERYRRAIAAAGLVPYGIDYEKKCFTFIGEDILKLTGYPAGEFTPAILKESVLESHVWGLEGTGIAQAEADERFLAGEIVKWGNDLRIRTRSGEERWISDVSVPLSDDHGRVTSAIGIFQDLTERKRAEADLQASRAAEMEFAGRLAILSETTTALSKEQGLDDLCRRTVELGRERLDLDRLSIWFLAEDHTTMLGSFGVDAQGRIIDERKESFPIGPDFPSWAVLEDQTPMLSRTDVPLALNGQVVGQGMHVTAGLWDGKAVIGYISVDNLLRQRPFSDHDCEIIRLYASAVGHLISLKRTELELQASRASEMEFAGRLTILSEATTELSKADSLDALCRRTVELGRERLDFDRLSVWFLSEDRQFILGTFGVDTQGRITDERGLQFPVEPEFSDMPVLQGQVPLLRRTDTQLALQGQTVGQGMHVSAGLWNGNSIIGYITVDNLLRQRPISDRDCEIIRLYASALGHLISLKHAEVELRTSEERYRMLAENMTDTIWLMDLELKTTYISPSVTKMRGYTLDELNSVPLDRQMAPESFARMVKLYTTELASERLAQAGLPISATLELEMYRKDGSSFWSENTFSLIRDPAGQPLAILGTARDVTESRKNWDALQNSEKRFRALIENSTDAIVLVDPRGRVLYESPAYGRMTGHNIRARLGRSSFEFIHPQDQPAIVGILNELVQSPNRTTQATFRNLHKDGSWRWIESTATNLLGETSVQAVVINMHDITERRQAEENIRQRVTELEVLYETGLHISSLLEPKEIGRKVIEVLSEKLAWRHASVRLVNPGTQRLELLVFNRPGLTAQQLQAETRRLNRIIAKPGQGLSGWVVQHGQPVRSGDVASDPRFIRTFPGIQSGLYVPMLVGGRTIGVIGVESETLDAFTEADQRLLNTLAAQAGIAIENARLLAESLRQVEELGALADVSSALRTAILRNEIVSVILDQLMMGLFHNDAACLVAYDPLTGGNIVEAARGVWDKKAGLRLAPGEGLSGRLAETRLPYQSQAVLPGELALKPEFSDRPEALAGIPLLVQGQFIGSLWIGRTGKKKTNPPVPFSTNEMRLLGSVADMAANALQRASLHEQALRHAEELLAVNDMGRLLAETLDLDQIYEKLDQGVWQLLGDICLVAISLYDSEKKQITCARFNTDAGLVDVATLPPVLLEPPGQGTQSEAIHTRQPVIFNNLRAQMEKVSFKMEVGSADGRLTQSGLFVPMLAQGRVIGVIQAQSYTLDRFSQSDAGLLSLVANTAAADIENARLFAETQKRLHNLAALHEIDVAISASVDIHVTLDILLEQTIAELHVDAAAVLLLNPLARMLDYAAGQGFRNHQVKGLHIPLGAGLAGQAALQRQIQSVSNLPDGLPSQDLQKPSVNIYAGEGFLAHHAIPLSAKGQVQGVLEVFLRSSFQPDDEWFTFLETLSRQAAIAIDNSSLYDDLQRSNTNIVLAYDATIQGWSQALELRDKETEGHARRVTERTVQLAQLVGVPAADLEHVRRGTLLHDIGKMGIPDVILLKPGKLTEAEWVIMRRHPMLAYEMLSSIAYLRPALDIPHYHHEKWDGTGYPDGLKGEQIPLYARIFAIVDVYDALTNDRPYRPAWTPTQTLEYIRAESGKHFDPAIVEAFLNLLARET